MIMGSTLKRTRILFLVIFTRSSLSKAEGKVWTLAELENNLNENNLEIRSIQDEQEIKKVERTQIESRFQPTLYGKAGFISEKTIEEERTGAVATLEGRWNIYRGGKDDLARKTSDLAIRSITFELASRQQSLIYDVRSLFYNLLALKEKKTILKQEIQSNDRQRKLAKGRAASGVATSADELEFRLRGQELESLERSLQSEEEKDLILLRSHINIPQDQKITVSGNLPDIGASPPQYDVNANPSILRLQNNLEIINQEKNKILSAYQPEIDAFASIGKIYPSESYKKVEAVIGVTLSMPIYDGRQRMSSLEIAQLSKQKAEIDMKKLQIDTANTLQTIEIERKETERLREINEQRLAYAQKYLALTVQEYDRGVKNSPDVVGAMEHLLGSKIRRIDLALQSAVLGTKGLSLAGSIEPKEKDKGALK